MFIRCVYRERERERERERGAQLPAKHSSFPQRCWSPMKEFHPILRYNKISSKGLRRKV